MADLEIKTVFKSEFVHITEAKCHAPKSGFGDDEFIESPRLIFPRRGVFECRLGKATVVADCNTVLLFNKGDTYSISHPCEGGDDCSVFVFPPNVLSEALSTYRLARPNGDARPFSSRYTVIDTEVQYRQRMFHHALGQGKLDTLETDEAAYSILSLLVRRIADQQAACPVRQHHAAGSNRRTLAEQVRALIASQPEAHLSLQEIARQVHYSPFYLARLFRAEVGFPLHHYRLRLRLALALERIVQGEDDLGQMAIELGFRSHSHFTASFKRFFGYTPTQIRVGLTKGHAHKLSKILTAR